MRSATPGTKTTLNARPRASSRLATKTLPYRGSRRRVEERAEPLGEHVVDFARSSPARRRAIGRETREDLEDALGLTQDAAGERREAREPVAPQRPRPASRRYLRTTGSANACSSARLSRSRVFLSMRGSSGSSFCRLARSARGAPPRARRAAAATGPRRRSPAESTSSRSHRHGAEMPVAAGLPGCRRDPRRDAASSTSGTTSPSPSSSGITHASSGAATSSIGTCASDRYSANRVAESSRRRTRAARGTRGRTGRGDRVPRSKCAGMPARSKACSSSPAYCCGERRRTAISSNRTPMAASFKMRRAISTHSRASPGADSHTISPVRCARWAAAVGEEMLVKPRQVGVARVATVFDLDPAPPRALRSRANRRWGR